MGGELPYVNGEVFNRQKNHCHSESVKQFVNTRKMGSDDFCKEYLDKLELDLNELGLDIDILVILKIFNSIFYIK